MGGNKVLLFLFTPAGVETALARGGDDPEPGVAPPPWDEERHARLQRHMKQHDAQTPSYTGTASLNACGHHPA
jgi:hypothetical protein